MWISFKDIFNESQILAHADIQFLIGYSVFWHCGSNLVINKPNTNGITNIVTLGKSSDLSHY
jgi:hypothetical protein